MVLTCCRLFPVSGLLQNKLFSHRSMKRHEKCIWCSHELQKWRCTFYRLRLNSVTRKALIQVHLCVMILWTAQRHSAGGMKWKVKSVFNCFERWVKEWRMTEPIISAASEKHFVAVRAWRGEREKRERAISGGEKTSTVFVSDWVLMNHKETKQ